MLPIARYPSVVDGFLPRLEGILTGINDSFIGRNDQSTLNHWLTDADWSEEKLDRARKETILEALRPGGGRHPQPQGQEAYRGRQHPLQLHRGPEYPLNHQLVTSHLAAGRLSLSIDFELYRRDEGQGTLRVGRSLPVASWGGPLRRGFPSSALS